MTLKLSIIRFAEYDKQVVAMLPLKTHQLEFDRAVDLELASDPDCGDVIAATGGFRKVRAARPDQAAGKRGGARVIYYHVHRTHTVFLFTTYPKGEADDLSEDGKKILRKLAAELDQYEPPSGTPPSRKRNS